MNSENIDKLLVALENVEPQAPNEQLLNRLEDLAVKHLDEKDNPSLSSIIRIAASLVLLLSVNTWVIQDIKPHTSQAPPHSIQGEGLQYYLIPAKSIYS